MSEEELSENEKRLFSNLKNEMTPPASLEEKIVSQLSEEGLIKKSKSLKIYMRATVSIAATVLIFIGGIYFERERSTTPISINPESGYMLILLEDLNFIAGDPEAMAAEYGQWMQHTFERGVKITGQELDQQATVVRNESLATLMEPGTKEVITGYFLLEANSLEEALAVAKDNPHIKYGGTIMVKSFLVR